MKFNKLILVSILLLTIFTLGSVSAVSEDINSDILTENGDLGEIIDAPNEDLIDSSQEDLIGSTCDDELNQADDENLKVSDFENIGDEEQSNGEIQASQLKDDGDGESQDASFDDLFTLDYPDKIYLWGEDDDFYGITLNYDPELKGNITFILNGNFVSKSDLSDAQSPGMIYVTDWFSKIGQNNCTLIFENDTVSLEKTVFIEADYNIWAAKSVEWGASELQIFYPQDAKGELSVWIDGVEYELISINNPEGYKYNYVNIPSDLKLGSHEVILDFAGDDKYPARRFEGTFNVLGQIDVPYSFESSKDKIYLKLPKDAEGSLIVKIYDDNDALVKTFTKQLSNGEASISFTKFYGFYKKLVVEYNGTDYPCETVERKNVHIYPPISTPNNYYQGVKKTVSMNLPGKTGTLKFYIGKSTATEGKAYTAKLVDGKASITLDSYTAGKYYINIQFTETTGGVTQKYNWFREFTVYKPVKFTPSTSAIYYGDGKYKVKLTNSSGKALAGEYVSFKINGKYITKVKTNKTGWAVFKIPTSYVPKTYKFTVSALGKTYNKNATVKQVLTLKAVTVKKYAKSLVLTATLKKGKTAIKGKSLTFKFNGKTYKATTNKNGIAKVTIKKSVLRKLKIGKKVTYQVTYIKDVVKRTAKVKR